MQDVENIVHKALSDLKNCLSDAVSRAIEAGALPNEPVPAFVIEVPADRANGDFATNIAMVSARAFKLPPRKIAEILAGHLFLDGTYCERFEIAGPGFINFTLGKRYYSDAVAQIAACGDQFGRSNHGGGTRVMVEFVSANPTGPMHIGNARGGALGDALAEILDWAGFNAHREFYVNDAGNQIARLAASLEIRYLQHLKGEDAVEFPEDGYHGADITESAAEFAAEYGDKYIDAPADERRQALVGFVLPRNVKALEVDLARYRIHYDTWFRESSLYDSGELRETIDLMKQKGLTFETDGTLWYKATEHGGEKDEVLIRQNGNPTYFAADIAYHRNKLVTRGFDRVVNVWGADHHGHISRLKGAMDAIGIDGGRLDIVLMQLVRLFKDGEPVRVSKRTGKSITLSTLLDDIPVDAARFFFNMREANSTLDFDLDLAIQQNSQNPVYYVQYAHARICSIVKNLAADGIQPRTCIPDELDLLAAPEERELIRHLSAFPDEIVTAAQQYDPARITHYAQDLATVFHKFYSACRVKTEDEGLMQARLTLCIITRQTLRNILSLLKIDAPEVM